MSSDLICYIMNNIQVRIRADGIPVYDIVCSVCGDADTYRDYQKAVKYQTVCAACQKHPNVCKIDGIWTVICECGRFRRYTNRNQANVGCKKYKCHRCGHKHLVEEGNARREKLIKKYGIIKNGDYYLSTCSKCHTNTFKTLQPTVAISRVRSQWQCVDCRTEKLRNRRMSLFENLPCEVWKKVNGFPDYSVSTAGRVRNDYTYQLLKPQRASQLNYLTVTLFNNGIKKQMYVHRMVLSHFVPNPLNKRCGNHINCNVKDNSIFNLEWVSHKENMVHSQKNGRMKPSKLTDYDRKAIAADPCTDYGWGRRLGKKYDVDPHVIYNTRYRIKKGNQ